MQRECTLEFWLFLESASLPANKPCDLLSCGNFRVSLWYNSTFVVTIDDRKLWVPARAGEWVHLAVTIQPGAQVAALEQGVVRDSGPYSGVGLTASALSLCEGVPALVSELRVWAVARTPEQVLATRQDTYLRPAATTAIGAESKAAPSPWQSLAASWSLNGTMEEAVQGLGGADPLTSAFSIFVPIVPLVMRGSPYPLPAVVANSDVKKSSNQQRALDLSSLDKQLRIGLLGTYPLGSAAASRLI